MARPRVKGPVVLNANGAFARLPANPWPATIFVGSWKYHLAPTPSTGPGPSPSPHVIPPLTPSGPKAR